MKLLILICNIVTILASLLTIFFSIKAVRNLKRLTKPRE